MLIIKDTSKPTSKQKEKNYQYFLLSNMMKKYFDTCVSIDGCWCRESKI
jgi:hypothetical protein